MNGKTVVMTGGTSGIGEVAALSLARMGARVVFVARDKAKAEAMLARLRAAGPAEHRYHLADLFLIAEQKRVAAEIAAAEPAIDVLINNAGAYFSDRAVTAEGLERSFALNHMAYFTLTTALLAKIKPGGRIVSTSSYAHRMARLDLDDLQSQKEYRGFTVYGTTKLMNILFTRELARRLEGSGIAAYCLHPGFVATHFADNNRSFMGTAFAVLKRLFAISPEKGAATLIHLATSPKVVGASGSYWYKCAIARPEKPAQSEADAARLWALSEKIAYG